MTQRLTHNVACYNIWAPTILQNCRNWSIIDVRELFFLQRTNNSGISTHLVASFQDWYLQGNRTLNHGSSSPPATTPPTSVVCGLWFDPWARNEEHCLEKNWVILILSNSSVKKSTRDDVPVHPGYCWYGGSIRNDEGGPAWLSFDANLTSEFSACCRVTVRCCRYRMAGWYATINEQGEDSGWRPRPWSDGNFLAGHLRPKQWRE